MVGDMPVLPALRPAGSASTSRAVPSAPHSYLVNVLHGDLGYSMNYRRPVDILAERVPRTPFLAGTAKWFGLLIGITIAFNRPLRRIASIRPGRAVDRGYAMPTFCWPAARQRVLDPSRVAPQGMGPMTRASGVDWLPSCSYLVPLLAGSSWKRPA
jgi:hypothetical protein